LNEVPALPEIRLAHATRADAAELIAANLASCEHHAPWLAPFTDQAGFDTWFALGVAGPRINLVAREPGSRRVAGVIKLGQITRDVMHNAFIGYYGMRGMGGRGLMTAAVRAAAAFAFEEVGLHRIEAAIQVGNAASIALIRRAGFRFEGVSPELLMIGGAWRDCERWALLAREL
jgi:ribosomal-protein-alanine N-acetyltransferase